MDIKVSVVVPVFNCEKYLSTCLDSLINQTLNDIEIICIDDAGSKDNSSKILENYAQKDSRIKILKTPNQYVGLARNQGVKLAKGEYLIFVDSDDWLEINGLELAYNKIKSTNSDVLFYNTYFYQEKTKQKNKIDHVAPYYACGGDKVYTPEELKNCIFNTSAMPFKMYKRDFWVKNDIKFSHIKFMEDVLPLFNCLINAERICILRECIYNYRVHYTNSSKGLGLCFKDVFDGFQEVEKLMLNHKNFDMYKLQFLKNRVRIILVCYKQVKTKYKKMYYKEMQKTFKYLTQNYDPKYIIEIPQYNRIQFIIKHSFWTEMIFYRLRLFYYCLSTYFI